MSTSSSFGEVSKVRILVVGDSGVKILHWKNFVKAKSFLPRCRENLFDPSNMLRQYLKGASLDSRLSNRGQALVPSGE